ncbi:MAG: AraC family transcriptional regulator [Proteobacteria bacterium]|uniref:AraC family transcriptional regulator n=1 Tax=Aquabacterium sp. TaxID=1872578 RepID=UPI0035C6CCC0|nr:AraC family transcriptional regulator [Pseudomonadota bacterium]
MDTLSLILDDMHFDGVVFASSLNNPPWAWRLAIPGVACAHVITRGQAWLVRDGAEPLPLDTGDLVVLPGGVPHQLQDRPHSTAAARDLLPHMAQDVAHARVAGASEAGTCEAEADTPQSCHLISTHARFDVDMAAPLVRALPPVLHVRGLGEAPPPWLAVGLQFLALEVSQRRPAQQAILNRMGDILFMQCIRDHVESVPEGSGNWLAALKDRALSGALAQMHRDPRHNWTVPELAQHACLSRSAFADRFTQALGEPPLTYLTRHRMRLAARQLSHSALPVGKVADLVGYASEAAFSQAFKREHGLAPSVWRQQRQEQQPDPRVEAAA